MKPIHRTANVLIFSFVSFPYILYEIESFLSEKETSETINAIHVNIRSLSKNVDNRLDIFRDSNYSFNVLCITETWFTDSTLKNYTNLHLPNFDIISQERKTTSAMVVC